MQLPSYLPRPLRRSDPRADEVLKGLASTPKRLPATYAFDDTERHARPEQAILHAHATDIASELGANVRLVTLATGDAIRTAQLLSKLHAPSQVVLVDRSPSLATRAARLLGADHRDVPFLALDSISPWDVCLPAAPADALSTTLFLGGSVIGELEPRDARAQLKRLRGLAGDDGKLLIGIDLKKDARTHEDTYRDVAPCAKNALARMNAELGATFDASAFEVESVYEPARGRVEVRLVATRWNWASASGRWFHFDAGERITAMIATKYTIEWFGAVAALAGWKMGRVFLDPTRKYALVLLSA